MECWYKCGTGNFRGCKYVFKMDKPRMVICPKCQHDYITWLNFDALMKWLEKK